uniref:RxLR effector candidate protein n=1 Tax=Peronospora matthiolae TaxID=2874970 RepID=A0AAV1TIX2_9STRA
MIKRLLLFVLLLSPGAVSDALLALTASTLPAGAISVKEQATDSKARGKQALKLSEDTSAAVGEERASFSFPALEEHLKAASEKIYDWFSRMASRSAFYKKAMQEVDVVWNKWGVTGEEYKTAWRKVEEASRVTETAWRRRLKIKLNTNEDRLRDARTAWEKKEAVWERTEAAWERTEAAWKAKLETIVGKEAESPSLDAQILSLKDNLAKDEWTYLDRKARWESKLEDWKKKEIDLKDGVNIAKWDFAERAVKTYLPQFEKLKAHGVTRKAYQNLLGLDPSTIANYNLKEDVITSGSLDGLQYAKYLYFDKFLEYKGSSKRLLRWVHLHFKPNK